MSPTPGGPTMAASTVASPSNTRLPLLRRPWAQTVLPFVTSLTLHAAIVVAAVAIAVGGGRIYRAVSPLETQATPTDTAIVEAGIGGVEHVGVFNEPSRPPAQDEYPDAGNGWAPKPGARTAASALLGGGDGQSLDPVIGASPVGGGIGIGVGVGPGTGDARGPGAGDGRGPLAPFGANGGGDVGFMGIPDGEPGRRGVDSVVYVCDASGSMINTFGSLKEQLVRSIQGLKAAHAFGIVFFQDEKCRALSDGLLFATPDNKRKAFKWLDEQTTTGTTNPIPGLELAFKAKPQLIYLLTDADFPDNNAVKTAIARLNKAKQTRINTIVFVPGDGDDGSAGFVELMKQIASDNGGVYAHVKESELR